MAIYLSFLVPKITAIVHAMSTKAQPTPSVWNHEHDRVLDFIPTASLLESRIVMRNGQFYQTELVGPPNAEKSHTHSQSHFIQHCKHGWVSPPPTTPTRNLSKCNESLKDPVRGGQAPPKCRYEAIVIGRVGICYM